MLPANRTLRFKFLSWEPLRPSDSVTAAELAETSCNSRATCATASFCSSHYLVTSYSSPFLAFFLSFFWRSCAAWRIVAPRPEIEPVPLAVESESEDISHSVAPNSLRPHGLWPTSLLCPWDSPGRDTGVGCHSLLQGIFLTRGSTQGHLHCRQSLYSLSPQGRSSFLFLLFPTLCARTSPYSGPHCRHHSGVTISHSLNKLSSHVACVKH